MTVSLAQSAVTYTANGSIIDWSFGFVVTNPNWLYVKTKDPSGVLRLLLSNEYSVTFINEGFGGGVVRYPLTGPALPLNWRIRLTRVLPLTQLLDFRNQDGMYPEVVEAGFDNAVMIAQQQLQMMMDTDNTDYWGLP